MLLTACASGTFDPQPGQDIAERVVWRELYGESGDPPPVEWVDGDENGSIYEAGDRKIEGLTLPGWKVQVARNPVRTLQPDGTWLPRLFSQTAYAHELMHWHTYLRTGDVDAAHWRGDWDLAEHGAFVALWEAGL